MRLFRREAKLLLSIDPHPHLCACFGSCVVEGRPSIILELHEGGTLEKALDIPQCDPQYDKSLCSIAAPLRRFDARWQLAPQLASALAHLHRLDILHCDVKPANVLLDAAMGHAVLSDFGIARRMSPSSSSNSPSRVVENGTQRYMAPEVVWDLYTTAADVYSFALLLWTLAYAERCFSSLNGLAVMVSLQANPDMRPPLLPPPRTDEGSDQPAVEVPADRWREIMTIVQDCWQTDKARRPAMKDVVAWLCQDHTAGETTGSETVTGPAEVKERGNERGVERGRAVCLNV